jgi:hypothetical protein
MGSPHRAQAAAITWRESAMTREGRRKAGTVRALGAAVIAMTAGMAWAGTTVVYRCLDSHLGVVYTDLPCKDGEAVDIRAGEADAAAVAGLERLRDMLDQSAAQRISDERRLAGQKELAAQSARAIDQARNEDENMLAYAPYGFVSAGYLPARPHSPRHRPMRPAPSLGAAPNPPYVVPRP